MQPKPRDCLIKAFRLQNAQLDEKDAKTQGKGEYGA